MVHLRRALTHAVGEVGSQVLVTTAEHYQLRTGLLRVDVDSFDAQLARAEKLNGSEALVEYERALAIGAADFLSAEIYDWAEVYRHDYQKRFVTAARRAAKLAIDRRDPTLAITFHEAILKRDPLDEEAVREVDALLRIPRQQQRGEADLQAPRSLAPAGTGR